MRVIFARTSWGFYGSIKIKMQGGGDKIIFAVL